MGRMVFLFNFFYHYFIIIIFFMYVVACVLLKKIYNNNKIMVKKIKIKLNCSKNNVPMTHGNNCSQASWEQCTSFNFYYHYFIIIIFFMYVVALCTIERIYNNNKLMVQKNQIKN